MFRVLLLYYILIFSIMNALASSDTLVAEYILRGRVVSEEGPLPFVNMAVSETSLGTVSNADGIFSIRLARGDYELRFSAVGFEERKMNVKVDSDMDLGDVFLRSDINALDPVVVSATMRPISRSDSPIPIQVLSPSAFRSDPTPSLMGALSQVNGVNPQLNCSVCNTSDIHINGMEGPYTLVLIDGMPIVSGLSTVYGLNGIPTSLIERIEIVKGPGSSLYGSEAMGGVLNVITKDPALASRVSIETMGTSWGEGQFDLGISAGSAKVSNLIGINGYWYDTPIDNNNDGFTDLTLQKRLSVFNKLRVDRASKKRASIAVRGLIEERWGGQNNWTEAYRGSDELYGEWIGTERLEAIAEYTLPLKEEIHTQFSFNTHHQDSYYGTTHYKAVQQVAFGQLYWSKDAGSYHDLIAGISFRHRAYNDNTTATSVGNTDRVVKTNVPGVFIQDGVKLSIPSSLLLGYRLDHEQNHGLVHSPRIAYKYMPNGKWTVRGSFATGFRVVDVFTEDHAALTGSREVLITENLQPERSINGTVNIVRRFRPGSDFFELDLTLFHTYFSNRIIADLDSDPDLIQYANLDGSSVSQGVSFDQVIRLGEKWNIRNGLTLMEIYAEEVDQETDEIVRTEQLFAPRWSGTFNVEHSINKRTSVNMSGQWYGPMRLPTLPGDPRQEYSPFFTHLNAQITHRINNLEVFGGVKNLLDFVPSDPILRPFDPFDQQADDPVNNPDGLTFDTTYIYASLQGIRGFIGLRLNLD